FRQVPIPQWRREGFKSTINAPQQRRNPEQRLVAKPFKPQHPASTLLSNGPHGRRIQLRRSIQKLGLRGAEERFTCLDDRLARLVASRFWSLWPTIYPHGMA